MIQNIFRKLDRRYSLKLNFSIKFTNSYVKGKQWKNCIELPVNKVFQNITEKFPNNFAIHSYHQNKSFTYEQFYTQCVKLANVLIKQFKLKPGDRVGIYSYNNWEWYVVQMACTLADLILVNINPAYQAEQLAYTIGKVQLSVLFTSDKFKHSNYIQLLRRIIPQLKHGNIDPWNIQSKRFHHLKSLVLLKHGSHQKGFLNYHNIIKAGTHSHQILPNIKDHNRQANIQFTSGTTGLPKAATLSHFNIINNGYGIGIRCGYTEKDNICVPVPLYHCFGMIMGNLAALTRGAAVTYVGEGFDAKKALQSISKYKCTSLYGVPTMFIQYLRQYEGHQSQYDISMLRTGIIAGAVAPQVIMQKILNVLKISQITNCYGMTQTSPVSFQTSPTDSFHHKTTSVGTILDGLQAKITNEKGDIVPIGVSGQFCVKGWGVMLRYWGDDKTTKESIVDGWMKSGDIGVLDQKGYLSIVGRIKDMIIRGGQNIYPKEIEDFLRKLPDVIDVQVIGIPDKKFGEQVFALIKVPEDHKLTKEEVHTFCKGSIAHYKIPKYVKFVQQLPLTVTGKPQKFIMKKQLFEQIEQHGQHILKKYQIK